MHILFRWILYMMEETWLRIWEHRRTRNLNSFASASHGVVAETSLFFVGFFVCVFAFTIFSAGNYNSSPRITKLNSEGT